MKYMIGDDWRSLFDIVVVQARKPKFFTQQSRPFRRFNIAGDRMAWQRVADLERGQVYMEGTVFELLKMTGWHGSHVIYFGDQIFSDLADITLNYGWRTGAIIDELEKEIQTLNSSEFRGRFLLWGSISFLKFLILQRRSVRCRPCSSSSTRATRIRIIWSEVC